jgi:hypothetical protein
MGRAVKQGRRAVRGVAARLILGWTAVINGMLMAADVRIGYLEADAMIRLGTRTGWVQLFCSTSTPISGAKIVLLRKFILVIWIGSDRSNNGLNGRCR